MVGIIQNAAVFLMVGEMILFLLPDPSYERYLRFLIQLILILILLRPFAEWTGKMTGEGFEMMYQEMEAEMEESIKRLDEEMIRPMEFPASVPEERIGLEWEVQDDPLEE